MVRERERKRDSLCAFVRVTARESETVRKGKNEKGVFRLSRHLTKLARK